MLLAPIWSLSQTTTFTEKEVVEIDSLFQVYEQTDSLQKLEIKLLEKKLTQYQKLHILKSHALVLIIKISMNFFYRAVLITQAIPLILLHVFQTDV